MENRTENSTEALKANIEQDVHAAKEELAGAAKDQAEAGKQQAAGKLNDLSEAIDQVANSISENDKLGLASYVHSASSQLASLAGRLQESTLDELAHDAKELARRKPTAFMLGSVVVGFGLSRFVKASAHHHDATTSTRQQDQGYKRSDDFTRPQTDSSYYADSSSS